MIVFKNKGEIDPAAIRTFGVTVKDDPDSAIGYFGTGLKYAISICLRNGCDVTIFSGPKAYYFTVVTRKIRGKEFNIVAMNGDEMGFTTALGRDWEMWQAFRELYCNALDEGGTVFKIDDNLPYLTAPDDNEIETFVCVKGDAIEKAFKVRHETFITIDPLCGDDVIEAFTDGDNRTIYFRGIRVNKAVRDSIFNYNFLRRDWCDLTEDRTMKYDFQFPYAVQALIQQTQNEDYIRACLTASPTSFEGMIDYASRCRSDIKHSDTFMRVLGALREERKDNGINVSAILLHKRKVQASILPKVSIELNNIEIKMLKRAQRFVRKTIGLETRKFPLIICEDLGGSLARADMDANVMYLSKQLFSEGTKRVAIALIEEFTHLDKRVLDETVEQKWIYLELIASLGERIDGEPL